MEKKHFIILLFSTVLAAFLGAFWAVHLSRPPHQHLGMGFPIQFEEQEKLIEQQEEFFDKFNKDIDDEIEEPNARASFISMNNIGLKTEETKDAYKISVDLKPFNNDEKNVDIKIVGKTVLLSAKYKSKNKNEFVSSQFHQTFTLPTNVNKKAIKKEIKDDMLIITIPKK